MLFDIWNLVWDEHGNLINRTRDDKGRFIKDVGLPKKRLSLLAGND
jgi:hypothetical protein